MPRLLKNETQQRLTVSQQALRLAFSMLSNPKPVGYERQATDGALEVGLIGVAADLAIAACLYEIYGNTGIIRAASGLYLTASEALDRFRTALSSAIPRLGVITSGVNDPTTHLKKMENSCGGFPVVYSARAVALHAGAGTSHDVAFYAGKSVADFLALLAVSPKWKPYLRDIPEIPQLPKDRRLIAQELNAALSSKDKLTVTHALSGIFLVLPELTQKEPEWLTALQRVRVTPRAQDISILIKSLQQAKIGDIIKVGKGANAVAAKIDPTNPNALPIYTAGMKKKFENSNDQWAGYVATANAELDKDILSLPPIEAVYRFAAIGIENLGLPEEEIINGMSAHSIWPFIAGALDYQGTKGPCFFAVRSLRKSELGQFHALMKKVVAQSNRIAKVYSEYYPLLESAVKQKPVNTSAGLATSLNCAVQVREKRRDELADKLKARSKKVVYNLQASFGTLLSLSEKTDSLALPLSHVIDGTINLADHKFPILGLLIEAASEREDLEILVKIEANKELLQVATLARKAIQEIDYTFYGPQLQQ
jgi:hypothetical protein